MFQKAVLKIRSHINEYGNYTKKHNTCYTPE